MGDKVDKMEVDQPPPPPPPPQLVEVPVSATPPPYDLAALRWNSVCRPTLLFPPVSP